ncbi:MAG: helix-turn-helix domain-containing protein [Turicibacter sp.]|jgi:transcriptional regulator with XRE-family HTH domain|uniref:HTH cro/C1-type domain-containing protein n=1 Tax=Turicibacter faecis TaxID=2963365 RepID=A0ABN6ZJA3_9FIRM|nr:MULTISPECIES: helix-turn-helix transcriptional regulator [unclassified Turicibacter]MCI8701383.1 helix-turn-helix domain-containing protein [Turicibacter sp.]BEH92020.1 hypothetical protein T23_21220 [Turicibacter sp. TC023]MCU7204790.1 helix-turn-helix domain-containing protein [Turicibacter sp. TA25]MCU7209515.1 helix-turn-helix domain-containing protein [Turicibacter sp. 1E2]NCE78039.1 helix-turn-helix domain-containing protein [Turicibacter sp. TS3]
MEFNEKLQLLRQTKGISQEMLAEEIGVPKKLVVDWEAGKELPDMHNLMAISDWFNVSLDELLRDRIHLDTLNRLGFFEQEEELVQNDFLENLILIVGMMLMIMSFIFNHFLIGAIFGLLGTGIYYGIRLKKQR